MSSLTVPAVFSASVSGIDPFMRYRVCWKCLIRDCEIAESDSQQVRQDKSSIQRLEQDLGRLNEIMTIADSLYMPQEVLLVFLSAVFHLI